MHDPTTDLTYRQIEAARNSLSAVAADDSIVHDLVGLAMAELEGALGYMKSTADPITVAYMSGDMTLAEAVHARGAQLGLRPLDADQAERLADLRTDATPLPPPPVPEVTRADLSRLVAGSGAAFPDPDDECPFPGIGPSTDESHCRHWQSHECACCWCHAEDASAGAECIARIIPPCPFDEVPF